MNRLVSWFVGLMIIGELILIFSSWVLSALMIENVQSLISSEGVRWFFGEFTSSLLSPVLLWIILLSISFGCLLRSRILKSSSSYRERVSRRISIGVMMICFALIALLTFIPHAILLSATGQLYPSPFSHALVPILSFIIIVTSTTYGLLTHSFFSFRSVIEAMIFGLCKGAPLLISYLFFWQFLVSVRYVFMLC